MQELYEYDSGKHRFGYRQTLFSRLIFNIIRLREVEIALSKEDALIEYQLKIY